MTASRKMCKSCQRGDCGDCARLLWRESDACWHECSERMSPPLFTLSELADAAQDPNDAPRQRGS